MSPSLFYAIKKTMKGKPVPKRRAVAKEPSIDELIVQMEDRLATMYAERAIQKLRGLFKP